MAATSWADGTTGDLQFVVVGDERYRPFEERQQRVSCTVDLEIEILGGDSCVGPQRVDPTDGVGRQHLHLAPSGVAHLLVLRVSTGHVAGGFVPSTDGNTE